MNHIANKSSTCLYCSRTGNSDLSRLIQAFRQPTSSSQSQNVLDFVHGNPYTPTTMPPSSNNITNNNMEGLKKRVVSSNYSVTGRASVRRAQSSGQKSAVLLETLPDSHQIKKPGRPKKISRYQLDKSRNQADLRRCQQDIWIYLPLNNLSFAGNVNTEVIPISFTALIIRKKLTGWELNCIFLL